MRPSLATFHTLFLSLFFFSPLVATAGFTPQYSAITQCGPFSLTWSGSNVTTGPPYELLILPFDAPPAIFKLPDSTYDGTTKTGNYTLDKLPLKSGAQVVLIMDDGYGQGTGGVSLIQTVGSSSDASCLGVDGTSMSSFFTFNPSIPPQCSEQTVSWNSTRYREPPTVRGFIPGGQAFSLDRPTSNSSTQQVWDLHIREGTQFFFLVEPAASSQNTSGESNARTSPLITVTGKSSRGDACLNPGSPSSTPLSAPSTTILSRPSTTVLSAPTASRSEAATAFGNAKVAAIAGGVVGGLAFVAILCAAIVLYRSFKRKTTTYLPKGFGLYGSSHGTGGQQRSRPFTSSKNGFRLTNRDRSFAGITIASTQAAGDPSSRMEAGHRINTVDEFGISLGAGDVSRENSSARLAYGTPRRKREHAWRAHPHNPQAPTRIPSISAGAHSDADGDQPVSAEYAFGSHRGLNIGARMEGAGNVGGNRSRENEVGTEYVRHTDAGAVRVVELPPLYSELHR